MNWMRTKAGHAWARETAVQRELRRLARRANCSLKTARSRREKGFRFCEKHGWYRARLCLVCKEARRQQRKQNVVKESA